MSKPIHLRSSRSAESAARQFGDSALDNRVPVATPENVAFRYEVAGPFTRTLSLILDFVVLIGVSLIIGVFLLVLSVSIASFFNEFFQIALGIFLAFVFVFTWFYGAVCETFWGKTIGKWVCRLRVLTVDGRPINGTQAVVRNFLRLADMMPGLGAVGFVVMSMNRRFQRLGDLAAGTIVIHEQKKFHRTVESFDDPRVVSLAEYIPASFVVSNELAHTLSMYVQRRDYFSVERTREIASHLAIPLLRDFGLPDDTSYDLLMCSLYYQTFLATEDRKEREWRPPQLPQQLPQANQPSSYQPIPMSRPTNPSPDPHGARPSGGSATSFGNTPPGYG